MLEFAVYEKINPIWGDPYTEYVGTVVARNEKSAMTKAAKQFKYDKGGVPARRRKVENFKLRVRGRVYND